jgi:hypothetical protein
MNTTLDFHSYKKYAGTTQRWDLFDSQERFNDNLKENFSKLKENNWIDQQISYSFNSQGFRSDEFNNENNSIMFVGCSLTFGTGLPIEETYGHKIASALKLSFYNLALGGTSNDTAFRLSYHYISKLKPKILVLASPETTRLELCKNQEIFYYRPQLKFYQIDSFYKKWISDDTNSFLNYQKNSLAIENLCLKQGIKFLQFDAPSVFLKDQFVENDYARDLIHPGIKTHNRVYEKIILNC